MQASLVLLTSPLVGPSVWQPAAEAIRSRGAGVAVVDLRSIVTARGPELSVAVGLVHAASPDRDPVVLVPHSGAGPLTPWLLAETPGALGAVFVDAGVPLHGVGRAPLAPPGFLEHLRGKANEKGMLPPWSAWWDADVMADLIPDDARRKAVEAEMEPLPLGYFESSVPVPAAWPDAAGAFLALGADAHAEDAARARRFGWEVHVLAGAGHLHMAKEPDVVADAVLALAAHL